MTYPFRYKLGDVVTVVSGVHKGQHGAVKALELSRNKTIAVLDRGRDYAPFREPESNLILKGAKRHAAEPTPA